MECEQNHINKQQTQPTPSERVARRTSRRARRARRAPRRTSRRIVPPSRGRLRPSQPENGPPPSWVRGAVSPRFLPDARTSQSRSGFSSLTTFQGCLSDVPEAARPFTVRGLCSLSGDARGKRVELRERGARTAEACNRTQSRGRGIRPKRDSSLNSHFPNRPCSFGPFARSVAIP